MKRALKKKEKAVLENTQSEDVPVEEPNPVNPRMNHRVPTKAAMIGLAISVGATSLLVTRQSDQALAAEPVGNQNTASTIPAVANLESEAVSFASRSESPVLVEPTAISQVPGLGAKLQIAASGKSLQAAPLASKSQLVQKLRMSSANAELQTVQEQLEIKQTFSNAFDTAGSQPTFVAVNAADPISTEVNAQLKAQQEFALNRLQQKSNRLKASLTELRLGKTQQVAANTAPAVTLDDNENVPQANASGEFPQQDPEKIAKTSQASLISRLKREKAANLLPPTPAPIAATPTVVTPIVKPTVATPIAVTASTKVNYEVKPGDTLAAIARAHGTSVSELVKANNLTNPDQLQINQQLILPIAASQTTTQIATGLESSSTFKVANSTIPVVRASLQTSNPIQVDTKLPVTNSTTSDVIHSEAVSNNIHSSYGMGGDSPIPQAISEIQVARQQDTARTKNLKNDERLRSLQEEIERLRAKYRAQQSGNSIEIENVKADNIAPEVPKFQPAKNVAVPIPVSKPSNLAQSTQQAVIPNQTAVPILVPQPRTTNYSSQPIKPSFGATVVNNEPLNPEFVRNQNIQVSAPPKGIDASQSLGARRGTKVSPELPPLAAVDTYLPKPIDEIQTASNGYIWPAKGVLTSGYGWRWGRMHRGIDIANSTGTPVYAAANGVVERSGWNNGGYGNLVEIRHPDGTMTRYAHNSKLLVRPGQQVNQGDTIALMGSTGFSTGPHTHFEIHKSGKGAVNPIAFLPSERL